MASWYYALAMNDTLTLRLGPKLSHALKEEARQTGLTRGEIVRQALETHAGRRQTDGNAALLWCHAKIFRVASYKLKVASGLPQGQPTCNFQPATCNSSLHGMLGSGYAGLRVTCSTTELLRRSLRTATRSVASDG